jgi:hypothetical protein
MARRDFMGRIMRLTVCLGGAMFSAAAQSESFSISEQIEGSYRVTTGYALAMRVRDPHGALINGEVDPLRPEVLPQNQLIGFTHTGLSKTINMDDGNRNFRSGSIFNNRVSAYGEFQLTYQDYGAIFSGSAFYDQAYHEKNDNDSPETVNKLGAHDKFTESTKYYNGERARLLEAYAYGNWMFGDEATLNLRIGQQLVAWGESLFFSGVAGAQGPADATKAFVPGAEIKDILLPVNQIALRLGVTNELSLLGSYKLDYRSTELFPTGDFFSPADLIGPGARFVYGSINPAALDGCPGLLGPLSPLCNLGGIGTPLLNAPPNILVYRGEDLKPGKSGQWGAGLTYQVTPITNLGLYRLRYHDSNPAVQLNPGFAFIGSVAGVELTTGLINQYVPTTYNVKYFGGIDMTAISYSTVLGKFNVAGEFSLREGLDMPVQTIISGVLSPVYTRGDVYQALLSSIYVTNPGVVFDELNIVSEAGYVYVDKVDAISEQPGIQPIGGGDRLFYDRNAWGFQTLMIGRKRNLFPGWDLSTPVSFAMLVNGNPSMTAAFGPLIGEDDRRLGLGASMQYLQNLEFAIGYNLFFGNPRKGVRGSIVKQNPYADRDYVTFNIKYNL